MRVLSLLLLTIPLAIPPCPPGCTDDAADGDGSLAGLPFDGSLPHCDVRTFVRPSASVSSAAGPPAFAMQITADPQFPWWSETQHPTCADRDCVWARTFEVNDRVVGAMNRTATMHQGVWPAYGPSADGLPDVIPSIRGTIINGDLTAYGHADEFIAYERYYHGDGEVGPKLQGAVYPGLGNHDYENNLDDCWYKDPSYLHAGSNGCALHAISWMRRMASCRTERNFRLETVHAVHAGSGAYAWTQGQFVFVQLQNHPDYTATQIGVTSSMDWLEELLIQAQEDARWVVLTMHNVQAAFANPRLVELARTYDVVAAFGGHYHERAGYFGHIEGTDIPLFLPGAPEWDRYLLAEFGEGYLRAAVVSTREGEPVFEQPESPWMYTVHPFAPPGSPKSTRQAPDRLDVPTVNPGAMGHPD